MSLFRAFTVRLQIVAPAAKYATPADLVYRTKEAVKVITVTFVYFERDLELSKHSPGQLYTPYQEKQSRDHEE